LNDEGGGSNDDRMTKSKRRITDGYLLPGPRYASSLGIRHSFVIRHWAFVICVQRYPLSAPRMGIDRAQAQQPDFMCLVRFVGPDFDRDRLGRCLLPSLRLRLD